MHRKRVATWCTIHSGIQNRTRNLLFPRLCWVVTARYWWEVQRPLNRWTRFKIQTILFFPCSTDKLEKSCIFHTTRLSYVNTKSDIFVVVYSSRLRCDDVYFQNDGLSVKTVSCSVFRIILLRIKSNFGSSAFIIIIKMCIYLFVPLEQLYYNYKRGNLKLDKISFSFANN